MRFKKAVSMALAGAMAASLMVGCGSSGSGTEATGSGEGTQTAQTGDKQEVVIWDYFETDAQKKMMESLINGFNSSQDEYVASHTYVPFADYEKQFAEAEKVSTLPDSPDMNRVEEFVERINRRIVNEEI